MAAQEDQSQERTEQPTPKRLKEAREKGQIPRSRELTTVVVLLGGAGGLLFFGPHMLRDVANIMRHSFMAPAEALESGMPLWLHLRAALVDALWSTMPFFAVTAAAALLAPLALGGWAFSVQSLAFKWEKLDPVKGLKRMVSWRGLMELWKALAKFLLVTGMAVLVLWNVMGEVLSLGARPLAPAMAHAAWIVMGTFAVLCGVLILVATVDVPFQIWNHNRQLRMSHKELRDELKETEGKPEVKGRIRDLQREVAQRRMMEAVPEADVVVTNPTHYAVALRYDPKRMQAPRLVAKGSDLVALRIRAVARKHQVPIVDAPELARAVYFSTRLEREIPAGLYLAVAQVLAYVYGLRHGVPGQGSGLSMNDLPIPEELRRGDSG